ncbi:hypothetical protein BDF20DRAFT_854722 [Mycotypha africana]|uniref:uncharacterized protein n=1 Tax=Mycotypha africana TaxID=64632 RepID=UPI002300B5D5|nr:uncharacterized protein BDF20DRAFT_854722 [Mycotypha africana]KAI8988261.1 hypothetical protein BDF20DRAFT_854722 [Mycotypha africana]
MIETVRAMFPDISVAAIQADLQRTGSVETTVDNALRNGTLSLPPSARPSPSLSRNSTPNLNGSHASGSSISTGRNSPNHSNLIQRYKIDVQNQDDAVEPPKVWEASPDKRQEILKKRKEFMVLQARKKLMEQQMKKKADLEEASASTSTATPASSTETSSQNENMAQEDCTNFDSMSVEELNSLTPEQRRDQMLQALQKRTNATV